MPALREDEGRDRAVKEDWQEIDRLTREAEIEEINQAARQNNSELSRLALAFGIGIVMFCLMLFAIASMYLLLEWLDA